MIAPLRRRHRWLAPGAFGVAAVGLVLGVMARPKEFVEASHGLDAREPPAPGAHQRLAGEPPMSIRWSSPPRSLWLLAEERIEAADVLAYSTVESEWTGDLPGDAKLLGEVAPIGWTILPEVNSLGKTRIVLYSLGQKRVIRTISESDLEGGDS